ncbi:hypothetical protein AKJ16_DCAP19507 [Drosera capensis]
MEKTNAACEPTRGPGKNKRMWTNEEEAALVDALYEMAPTWRVENGFKVGCYAQFEKLLDEKLPGYGLKADPHIKSKVKMLKRQLGYIMEIKRGCIGFGWDEERRMVTGDKETYMRWAKSREQAGPLYMKPFVHFDKLYEIFSKERANGNLAHDLLANDDLVIGGRALGPEVEREVYGINDALPNDMAREHYATPSEEGALEEAVSANPVSAIGKESHKRKASRMDAMDVERATLSKCLGLLVDAQSGSVMAMEGIQRYFLEEIELSRKRRELLDAELEVSKKRKQLVGALLGLPGLDTEEVVRAASIISQDATKIELFFSMPRHVQLVYARSEIKSSKSRT